MPPRSRGPSPPYLKRMYLMRLLLAASAIALLVAAPAVAQSAISPGDKTKSPAALHPEARVEQAKPGSAAARVEERPVQPRHSAAVSGHVLPYTATAGTLTIRDN